MKQIIITALFLAFIPTAHAEELKSPEDLLVAYVAATGTSEFTKVVDSVHPFALKSFKAYTLNIVKAAVKEFSEDAVKTAFQGLGSLSDLDAIPEQDFWVYVMSNLYSIYPECDDTKSLNVVGHIVNGNLMHVLYTQNGDLKSTDSIENLKSPKTFTFRKDGERWCYWSISVSGVEKYVQFCAKRQQTLDTKANRGDVGTTQPATRPESKSEDSKKPQPKSEGHSR